MSRFVLADTESLHKKLNEMSVRIRQLEDALQIAHARTNSETHPLLEDHLLEIKHGIGRGDYGLWGGDQLPKAKL